MNIKKPNTSMITTLVNWYVTRVEEKETRTILVVQSSGDKIPRKYTVLATNGVAESIKRQKLAVGSCVMVQGAAAPDTKGEYIYARLVQISGKAFEEGKIFPSIETREFRYAPILQTREADTQVSVAAGLFDHRYFIYAYDDVAESAKGVQEGDMVSVLTTPMVKIVGQGKERKLAVYWKATSFYNQSR